MFIFTNNIKTELEAFVYIFSPFFSDSFRYSLKSQIPTVPVMTPKQPLCYTLTVIHMDS